MREEPVQPLESAWRFVEDLKSPLWTAHQWSSRAPHAHEADLRNGVRLDCNFDDHEGLLETAYEDLEAFLRAGDVKSGGDFVIETRFIETEIPETFHIDVRADKCVLAAADTEGIRRAIFHIEDEMRRAGGPFLPLGLVTRTPVIRTRISRCFFGPIKRPPKNRDDLTDDVDYYPEEYLNCLAHDGVNALWITVSLKDLCRSELFASHGVDAERRLAKLRQTVRRCARYGIRIYVFCIEPMAFGDNPHSLLPWSSLEGNSELAGHTDRAGQYTSFCTSSETGQRYLEESTFFLFQAVPGLGGLIDINVGERATHCYCNPDAFFKNNCPRCSQRRPGEVFADTLSALARGMQRANPAAELVSWIYIPYLTDSPDSDNEAILTTVREIAASVPSNVTLQVNFESLGENEQCGRKHTVLDYSLSFVGPSQIFRDCAANARDQRARVGAKLQVGCSHEVATVPFVPVPGNLYRKYRSMHDLGVSTVMQCWYFGNYPSPMTKAAGLLSFAPLPETEDDFLRILAEPDWGEDTQTVVTVWRHFREAYAQLPSVLAFSWYGPLHDSIAWPLHLFPVDQSIAPSWLLSDVPSGDRIGELFAPEFTLSEIRAICRAMAEEWEKGVGIMRELAPRFANEKERQLDIGVAEALGLQFRSASNVIEFYALREALPYQPQEAQNESLDAMREFVENEIKASYRLAALATADSRLGFHSEAEGYKYFPEKLKWRAQRLRTLLDCDFPAVQVAIRRGKPLFPRYTGVEPDGPVAIVTRFEGDFTNAQLVPSSGKNECAVFCPEGGGEPSQTVDAARWKTLWQVGASETGLYFRIDCHAAAECETVLPPSGQWEPADSTPFAATERVVITIEPRRLWPAQRFSIDRLGRTHLRDTGTRRNVPWTGEVLPLEDGWSAVLRIPWASLAAETGPERPIRVNVERIVPGLGTFAWQERHPLPPRNIFEDDNPAEYGWVKI